MPGHVHGFGLRMSSALGDQLRGIASNGAGCTESAAFFVAVSARANSRGQPVRLRRRRSVGGDIVQCAEAGMLRLVTKHSAERVCSEYIPGGCDRLRVAEPELLA
jgi:hypothetical protein